MGIFRKPERWQEMRHRAMTRNFGWERPAREYLELYEEIGVGI